MEELPPKGETIIIIMELIRVLNSLFIDLQIMFVFKQICNLKSVLKIPCRGDS